MTRTSLKRPHYVERIGESLMDLAWADRQMVLDDVAAHLTEFGVAVDDDAAWVERFGEPDDYAQQLRTDLGLGTSDENLRRARRRRLRNTRPRTKVLAAAAIVVVSVIVGASTWLANVQPFSFGSRTSRFGGDELSADGHGEHRWRWTKNGQFAIGTWMRNNSSMSVRVTAIPLPTDVLVPWDNWKITLGEPDNDDSSAARPFSPFTLSPGDSQLIWVNGDFITCPTGFDPGSSVGISDVSITYEVFGITRHERLNLGFTYGVVVDDPC